MPCYYPLTAWRSRHRGPSGKLGVTFRLGDGYADMPLKLPCGQCVGCRLERSRQWAVRCVHEAQMHDRNCFITLTFRDADLPPGGSLDVRHWQLFAKRMRKTVGSFRFFHCGEYGSLHMRPHYHAIIFGYDFPDRVLFKESPSGHSIFTSRILEGLWPYGFSSIGDVTFESAAYVARYVMKKVTGDASEEHYAGRKPEYTTMSRRPGIGAGWFDKFKSDVFPSDEVILKGKRFKPPRYYDRLFEIDDPDGFERIKAARVRAASTDAAVFHNSGDRLRVREKVKLAQISQLKRPL